MESTANARARLDRAIEIKTFEIECAEAIAGSWLEGSDRAWLLSVFEGALGTALAVTRGRNANAWADRAAAMRRELVELQIERRLLDQLGQLGHP